MNFIRQLLERKTREVSEKQKTYPLSQLRQSRFYNRNTISLRDNLGEGIHIIAEFKRKSPGRKRKHHSESIESITRFYSAYGAAAISIATDKKLHDGSLDDLVAARDNPLPLIRNDFIIDVYQLEESKAYGADAIMLHPELLPQDELKSCLAYSEALGLQVMIRLNHPGQMQDLAYEHLICLVSDSRLDDRRLPDFHFPELHRNLSCPVVAGNVLSMEALKALNKKGYHHFLMGEYFLGSPDPGAAFKDFMYSL